VQPKKLHTLLIKSFIPPFFITLFVSVFLFFLVEVVITYLDDFIGKGLGFWTLGKLFFYAWLAIIPKCIPLAVLLASIMTFGSLAENYELAAMKSSGLSLFRIIKPVFYCVIFLAVLTFVFNNFILPGVMLRSQSLLWDIRQAKPVMNIKEGIFYNKIDDYTMRVGKKGKDGNTLQNILIYDHTDRVGNNKQLYADSGEMKMSADTNYLVVKLRNGNRYEQIVPELGKPDTKSFSQLNFKELIVNIELTDFKLKRTDENAFGHHHEMMNVWQISDEVDSLNKKMEKRYASLGLQSENYFFYRTSNFIRKPIREPVNIRKFYAGLSLPQFNSAIENAMNVARTSSGFIDSVNDGNNQDEYHQMDFTIGWHEKINVCFACIVLFFVGAPLGAIIRKGGLGLPVVIAVFFFLAYFIFTEAFKALTIEGVLNPWIGMWLPLYIFLPVGIFLTYKAATDSALFDMDSYLEPIKKLFSKSKIKN
jgi:lipopolysaccharide export system permease protein